MSKISGILYKSIMTAFNICPFKRSLCFGIKSLNIPFGKLYMDFKFKGKFKVRVDHDNSFLMYQHGGTIENETFWKGLFVTWENETGWVWKQLCKCSDIVFDIGANTGIYSLITKSINPTSSVYAFEPSNNTFDKLTLNNSINNYNIKCEKIALSNKTCKQTFFDTTYTHQTSASLSADILKNVCECKGDIVEYSVQTMTMAQYIETNNIGKIDLIKIDIELHEPEAIQGFGKYLTLYKPIVIIEVLTDKVANELNNLIGDDFIRLHLKENERAEFVTHFKVYPGQWNYIFFHKDTETKIRQHTTLNW